MTPKKKSDIPDEDSYGILEEAAPVDTTAISILGGVAQVSVALPQADEDDFADEEVVDGEIDTDLILDTSAVAVPPANLLAEDTGGIVIELPAEELSEPVYDETEEAEESSADSEDAKDSDVDDEIVDPEATEDLDEAAENDERNDVDAESEAEAEEFEDAADADDISDDEPGHADESEDAVEDERSAENDKIAENEGIAVFAELDSTVQIDDIDEDEVIEEQTVADDEDDDIAGDADLAAESDEVDVAEDEEDLLPQDSSDETDEGVEDIEELGDADAPEDVESAEDTAEDDEEDTAPSVLEVAPTQEEEETVNAVQQEDPAGAPAQPDIVLTSKRLGDIGEEGSRESADLLTADRLLDPNRVAKPEPEGVWSHFLYTVSFGLINIGDSKAVRERKELSTRIAAPLSGGARFVPVLSRKGGVGKTTITTLLGMALADARDDRVIAVDANPDRGTLADRISRPHSKSVRDLVRIHDEVRGYQDISAIVARDETRLDVLASDGDPYVSEAFSDEDYRDVAEVAERFYSLILTDTGTGIVHSVMGATLDLADQIVIVSGESVDEARLASETLTWLEMNGYEEKARSAIVVLNQSTPGTPLVRLDELEAHFSTRVRKVVRVPFDAHIAGGGALVFTSLKQETRQAARELAALLVESLRAQAA